MNSPRKIRKAVLPAAGLGTRFLPASKAVPKEMLPLVDKPLIQHAVEEAVASGIEEIILVTRPGKTAIEEHFDPNGYLARILKKLGKQQEAESLWHLARRARFHFVQQTSPLGLGHAVGCARRLVGNEPFVVILPDDIMDCPVPCTKQLLDVYAALGRSVVATQQVRGLNIERGGVLKVEPVKCIRWRGRLFRVTDMVEKPKRAKAPSPYGIIGRYVLEPQIFSFLDSLKPGHGGEIQLTDAVRLLAKEQTVYAFAFQGHHIDGGSKLGFLCATVRYAVKHPELGPAFRRYLKSLQL